METHAETCGDFLVASLGQSGASETLPSLEPSPRTVNRPLQLPAIISLPVLLAVTIAASFVDHSNWPILAWILGGVVTLYIATVRDRWRHAKSFFWLMPMVIGVSLAPAASHGWSAGWNASGALLLRSLIAITAAAWMLAVTPFASILQLLRRCGLPGLFVDTLSLTGRYLHVLRLEFESMQRAQRSRSFGSESYFAAWSRRSQMIGLLILRSLNRAERVHAAMCARGYDGEYRRAD